MSWKGWIVADLVSIKMLKGWGYHSSRKKRVKIGSTCIYPPSSFSMYVLFLPFLSTYDEPHKARIFLARFLGPMEYLGGKGEGCDMNKKRCSRHRWVRYVSNTMRLCVGAFWETDETRRTLCQKGGGGCTLQEWRWWSLMTTTITRQRWLHSLPSLAFPWLISHQPLSTLMLTLLEPFLLVSALSLHSCYCQFLNSSRLYAVPLVLLLFCSSFPNILFSSYNYFFVFFGCLP